MRPTSNGLKINVSIVIDVQILFKYLTVFLIHISFTLFSFEKEFFFLISLGKGVFYVI